MSSESIELSQLKRLKARRQLSVEYEYNGKMTADDPSGYKGKEKTKRENALLAQCSNTGYADGIRERRGMSFFKPYIDCNEFLEALVNPVVIPPVLAFTSIYYFVEAMVFALDCLISSCAGLIAKAFDERLSKTCMQGAIDDFYAARASLFASLIHAVCSVWYAIDSSVKLLTKTASTLVCTITEPEADAEEENTSCFSCN